MSESEAIMNVNNQTAIDFVRSPMENLKSKHIDMKLVFISHLLYGKEFLLIHVHIRSNLAHILTKPITKHDFLNFVKLDFDI